MRSASILGTWKGFGLGSGHFVAENPVAGKVKAQTENPDESTRGAAMIEAIAIAIALIVFCALWFLIWRVALLAVFLAVFWGGGAYLVFLVYQWWSATGMRITWIWS